MRALLQLVSTNSGPSSDQQVLGRFFSGISSLSQLPHPQIISWPRFKPSRQKNRSRWCKKHEDKPRKVVAEPSESNQLSGKAKKKSWQQAVWVLGGLGLVVFLSNKGERRGGLLGGSQILRFSRDFHLKDWVLRENVFDFREWFTSCLD